jgi:hypothetical protein
MRELNEHIVRLVRRVISLDGVWEAGMRDYDAFEMLPRVFMIRRHGTFTLALRLLPFRFLLELPTTRRLIEFLVSDEFSEAVAPSVPGIDINFGYKLWRRFRKW